MFDRVLKIPLWYSVQNSVDKRTSSEKATGRKYGLIIKV